MLQEMQSETTKAAPARGRPAGTPARAASLSGAFLQRGRARAPRLEEVPPLPHAAPDFEAPELAFEEPTFAHEPEAPVAAPAGETEPAPAPLFAAPMEPAHEFTPPAQGSSRFANAMFALFCLSAFFATFMFVLGL